MKLELCSLHNAEIAPGIMLIGEPTPVIGTNLMRCLANAYGTLAVVELKVTFAGETAKEN